MSLKWDKVLDELSLTEDILQYVKDLFTAYSHEKPSPSHLYYAQKLLKNSHDEITQANNVEHWVQVVVYLAGIIGHIEEMVKFICKMGPHIIIAVYKKGTPTDLLSVSEALHPILLNNLPSNPAAHVFDVLWKAAIACHKEEPSVFIKEVRLESSLQVLALQYLTLTDQQLEVFGPKASAAVRNMSGYERQYHSETVWQIMLAVLEKQGAGLVKMAELIFTLPRLNFEDTKDLSHLTPLVSLLPQYATHLSTLQLEPLFDLVTAFITSVHSDTKDSLQLDEGVKEVLTSSNKDITWICLYSARLLSVLIREFTQLTAAMLPIVFQVAKLLLRSPQSGSIEAACLLLSHTHSIILPLYNTAPEPVFTEHSALLQLHVLAVSKADNNPVGTTADELLLVLLSVCDKLVSVCDLPALQLSCLQIGHTLPTLSVQYCVYHAKALKKQGFLSDALTILSKACTVPSITTEEKAQCQLLQAMYLIMRLEVGRALELLRGCDRSTSAACQILTIYCDWVTAINSKDEHFKLSSAAHFSKVVDTLLNNATYTPSSPCSTTTPGTPSSPPTLSSPLDPCLISITMLLCGVYGLYELWAVCSEYLVPSTETVNTMLCAVPSLVLQGQGVDDSWESIDDIAMFVEEPDKESLEEYVSSNVLTNVITNYLLIDFKLAACETAYDCSLQAVTLCLEAAHSKLKTFKKVPAKLLLWKSCCVLPLLLQVMERHVRLLLIWGSLHTALMFLETFEQISTFIHSNYWLTVHTNLLSLVYLSLGDPAKAKRVLAKDRAGGEGLDHKLLMAEVHKRLDEDKENQSSEVSLPSTLPLPSLLSLMLLRAQWCEGELDVSRAQEVLKRLSEEGCYVSQEHFKLFNALLSLELVRHPPPAPKPAPKRRGRKGTKAKATPPDIDHLATGLASCEGLYPVIALRALLAEQMKVEASWETVQQYHALPLQHQLHLTSPGLDESVEDKLSETWSVASITKSEDTVYIGRQCGEEAVLFKRDLPYSIKSCEGLSHGSCTDEMDSIIQDNDASIEITDKVNFWKTRFLLDKSLEALLLRLQNEWLGPWKGLLLGASTDPNYAGRLKTRAAGLRRALKSKHKVTLTVFISEYLLDSYSILTEEDIKDLLPSSSPEILALIEDKAPPATPARHPSLLCLGNGTELLPWEACPVYSIQTISRVPSLDFALKVKALRSYPVLLDEEKTYYVLNPRNDLPSTQSFFKPWLEEHDQWRGLVAKAPSINDYKDALNADLFLYLGHGSGKEFLKGRSVQEFESRAVALLMGCSSGRLKTTPLGNSGTPLDYLLSGCPAVVGYLWNVTDRDCDKFSKRLLELWLSQGSTLTLPSLVNPSREVCKLKYLTGAAPVVYGVPDILTGGG